MEAARISIVIRLLIEKISKVIQETQAIPLSCRPGVRGAIRRQYRTNPVVVDGTGKEIGPVPGVCGAGMQLHANPLPECEPARDRQVGEAGFLAGSAGYGILAAFRAR
jgi:hypothetical protein